MMCSVATSHVSYFTVYRGTLGAVALCNLPHTRRSSSSATVVSTTAVISTTAVVTATVIAAATTASPSVAPSVWAVALVTSKPSTLTTTFTWCKTRFEKIRILFKLKNWSHMYTLEECRCSLYLELFNPVICTFTPSSIAAATTTAAALSLATIWALLSITVTSLALATIGTLRWVRRLVPIPWSGEITWKVNVKTRIGTSSHWFALLSSKLKTQNLWQWRNGAGSNYSASVSGLVPGGWGEAEGQSRPANCMPKNVRFMCLCCPPPPKKQKQSQATHNLKSQTWVIPPSAEVTSLPAGILQLLEDRQIVSDSSRLQEFANFWVGSNSAKHCLQSLSRPV